MKTVLFILVTCLVPKVFAVSLEICNMMAKLRHPWSRKVFALHYMPEPLSVKDLERLFSLECARIASRQFDER